MGTSAYPRERLTEAARGARTMSEALRALGVDPGSSRRAYIRKRMKEFGVDTSHFERDGVKWTREILHPAVAASASVCEVLRRLGLDVTGGHHTHISSRIKAYAIDTSHFRASAPGSGVRRSRVPGGLLVQQPAESARRVPGDRLKRAMTAAGVPELCALCGMEAVWQGFPLPLEVDHIDGNWRDNRIGNLRLLCPNCHSTTDSYRGRGKQRPQTRNRTS
ncbi:HNH endonuclease signature motif containing protein [Streptomyces sp. NPDC047000]|uniref:HNH endonuclease signature motif containing protein n=1 Tax=Streptomyces sp. NPDC047000 TaxID=3155474 RepID=UPI00340B935E